MRSGSAVQTNGGRRVSREKNVWTAFSQEHEVSVKWNTKRGMAAQPAQDLGVFVGDIVAEDHVDQLAGWDRPLDAIEETE
jgi:hypothetical protein